MLLLITLVSDILRVYIIYIMEFHNFSHELEMIHNFNNTQGNKMIYINKHSIHEQSFMIIYRIIDF